MFIGKSAERAAFICLNLLNISIKSQITESTERWVPKSGMNLPYHGT
jgi:hypothetical protein